MITADDTRSPAVQSAIGRPARTRRSTRGAVHEPIDITTDKTHTVAVLSMPLAGNGSNQASKQALTALRDRLIPETLGTVDNVSVNVSGQTAIDRDQSTMLSRNTPLVFGFVLTLAFLLLMVTFRSIVIPIKAIILNLLSVAAAYGVLVAVFQDGHGASLLGFTPTGGVAPWLPLFLFVILFGLSMDYHVFILSRVKELVDGGMSTEDAVSEGIKSTAGTVTSAALVMVGRVLDLHDAQPRRPEGVRRRPRRRRPDRRDDHPRRPASRQHEAARGLELVPAQAASVAAAVPDRAAPREWRWKPRATDHPHIHARPSGPPHGGPLARSGRRSERVASGTQQVERDRRHPALRVEAGVVRRQRERPHRRLAADGADQIARAPRRSGRPASA